MTANALMQVALFLAVLLVLVAPIGATWPWSSTTTDAVATASSACSIDLRHRSGRRHGLEALRLAMLVFNMAACCCVYALQRVQQWLPLNPQHFAGAVRRIRR